MNNDRWLKIAMQIEPLLNSIKAIAAENELSTIDITVSPKFNCSSARTYIDNGSYYISACGDKTSIGITEMTSNGYRTEILN